MSNMGFLALGYGLIWALIGAYVISSAAGRRRCAVSSMSCSWK